MWNKFFIVSLGIGTTETRPYAVNSKCILFFLYKVSVEHFIRVSYKAA
jgi:hypothetical protein